MNSFEQTKKRSLTWICLSILMLFVVILFISACEPGGAPTIENQRNQDLRIYVLLLSDNRTFDETTDYGVVPALTTKRLAGIVFVRVDLVCRITARDSYGEVVFSHDYLMDDLKKLSWKIVIPP